MKPLELPGLLTLGTREAWALTSEDDVYRYVLGRCWDPAPVDDWDPVRPIFCATLLNPSKARHDVDDPTVRKLIHFAKQEGCGALLLRNLAAFCATDPDELRRNDIDIVGPMNAKVLSMSSIFTLRVAAWGNFPGEKVRRRLVGSMGLAKRSPGLHVFGLNKSGEPVHPLYLPNATRAQQWAGLLRAG